LKKLKIQNKNKKDRIIRNKKSPKAPLPKSFPITNHQSPITNHQSPITNHQSP
jgi:hypothetical protein